MIDLRSDTITKPTDGMRKAMANAEVGDDVFMEDPTVNALEERMAKMFGHEASLFCSSGTQTNQIAINGHTRPGEELICHELSHIYQYEGGGIAFNSGCSTKFLNGPKGLINPEEIAGAVRSDDVHFPRTTLLSVENTMNKAGGTCYSFDQLKALSTEAKKHGLKYHLDGARFFNAWVNSREPLEDWGGIFDSISICLSKGLGCPVGSLLIGSKEFIDEARRVRKRFGGGMRQAGILAAAGLYALDHQLDRLSEDNQAATQCAKTLKSCDWVDEVVEPESNILKFAARTSAHDVLERLAKENVSALALTDRYVRFVFHIDVTQEMLKELDETLRRLYI
jgi:threonine aldolase